MKPPLPSQLENPYRKAVRIPAPRQTRTARSHRHPQFVQSSAPLRRGATEAVGSLAALLNTWDPPSAPKRRLIHLATEQTTAPRLLELNAAEANLPHRSWAADVCAGRLAGRREASASVGMALENPARRAVLPSRPVAAIGFSGPGRKSF